MQKAFATDPLTQMLRSIGLQKRTGLLRVERLGEGGREQGEVYFEGGRPMRAQTAQETGKAALLRIRSWKNITCSFDGTGRPHGNLLAPAAPQEQSTEKRPVPTLSSVQTDRLPSVSAPAFRDQHGGETGPQSVPLERASPEVATQANSRTSAFRRSVTQPLVRRSNAPDTSESIQSLVRQSNAPEVPEPMQSSVRPSNTPEVSESAQPARATGSKRRWTTRLVPETLPPMPSQLPETPPPEPLPERQPLSSLPGRLAVFKPRAVPTRDLQQMERHERIIFILLDGSRTVQDIARLTHCAESEVELVLVRLTKRGYTEYVPEPQPVPTLREKLANLFSHSTPDANV